MLQSTFLLLRWVLAVFALSFVYDASAQVVSARKLMSPQELRATGLHKLSESEMEALDRWLSRYTLAVVQVSGGKSAVGTSGTYEVEAAVNDETFVINGNVFKAKTYCFGINKGDRVRFLEGSAQGACASAKFLVAGSDRTCNVWCE